MLMISRKHGTESVCVCVCVRAGWDATSGPAQLNARVASPAPLTEYRSKSAYVPGGRDGREAGSSSSSKKRERSYLKFIFCQTMFDFTKYLNYIQVNITQLVINK